MPAINQHDAGAAAQADEPQSSRSQFTTSIHGDAGVGARASTEPGRRVQTLVIDQDALQVDIIVVTRNGLRGIQIPKVDR